MLKKKQIKAQNPKGLRFLFCLTKRKVLKVKRHKYNTNKKVRFVGGVYGF